MPRAYLLAGLAGLALGSIGCNGKGHIAGKCDCTHDPADAVIPAPNNPYFPTATTAPQAPAVAAPMPAVLPATPPVTPGM